MTEIPTPPRHFWRRAGALIVDYALASLLVTLLLLPFLNPDRNGLRLTGFINTNTCQSLTQLPAVFAEMVAPDQINRAALCTQTTNFVPNGRTVQLVFGQTERRDGAVTYRSTKTLGIGVDKEGRPMATYRPQGFVVAMLIVLVSAYLLVRGKQSPGKRLLGLKVVGTGCALCREARRFAPFLLIEAVNFAVSASLPGSAKLLTGLGMWPLLIYGVLLIFWLGIGYVWPMIRWRGTMPYDRATGFVVTRAG